MNAASGNVGPEAGRTEMAEADTDCKQAAAQPRMAYGPKQTVRMHASLKPKLGGRQKCLSL